MSGSVPDDGGSAPGSSRGASPGIAPEGPAPARPIAARLFGVSLKVAGDDLPVLEALRALYRRLPPPREPAGAGERADPAAHATAMVEARLSAPTDGGPGRLALRVDAASRDVALAGDAARRALSAHLSIAQAAAARARGHVLHGALLARAADRILILGDAGSGKSTLALALTARGWSLWADDFAWLDADGRWRVTMLPALLDEPAAELLGLPPGPEEAVYRSADGRVLAPTAWPAPAGAWTGAEPDADAPETEGHAALEGERTVGLLLAADAEAAAARRRPEAPTIRPRDLATALAALAAHDVGLAGRRYLDGEAGGELLRSAARLHAALRMREIELLDVTPGAPALTAQRIDETLASTRRAGARASGAWPEGAVARMRSEGTSMRPLIAEGERLRVRAGADVEVGDVVAARQGRRTIVHRLIDIQGDRLLLRGDDTPAPDPPLPARALRGRVVAVEGLDARRLDGRADRIVGRAAAAWGRLPLGDGRGRRPRAVVRAAGGLRPRRRVPTAEERFVLLAARLAPSDVEIEAARALAQRGLDGATVLDLAWRAQLAPLVYRGAQTLEAGGGEMLDAATRDGLRVLYAASWARSRRVAALRDALLARLAAQGIPVLGHKGVVLTELVYGDPALRLQGDLDFSVPDAQRPRAEAAVRDLLAAQAARHPDLRDPDALSVELDGTAHHDVDPSSHGQGRWACQGFDWAGIWRRARRIEVGESGVPLLVPAPSDLLLTLIANCLRRGAHTGRLLADLSAASHVLADEIDWDAVAVVLRRTGLGQRSWWPLGLAVDHFGAAIPASLCEAPPGLRLAPWERAILRWRAGRPFARVPTRLLWAGSATGLLRTSGRIGVAELRRRMRSVPGAGGRAG